MANIKNITLKLNKRSEAVNIPEVKASDLPTLIGDEKLNILTEGDDDPYFFSQGIQFPIEGNGDVYTEEFFKSFLARNSERAFPGDKYGHDIKWYNRQPTHFYQIGGEIRGNIAYFKFYVPSQTDTESNDSFKKEIKTNGIDLSLVSKVSYKYNESDQKYYILTSEGAERNDAVGFGDGSMEQAVFNSNKNIEEDSVLTLDELITKLNAFLDNKEVSKPELFKKLNCEALLKTDADVENLKVLNSLVEKLGDKPIEKADELLNTVKTNAETVREAGLETAFGKKLNADGTENTIRTQGELLLANKDCTPENIEAVKKNSLFIAVAGNLADENSKLNKINKDSQASAGGIKHVKV
jgi:hypothetical protein